MKEGARVVEECCTSGGGVLSHPSPSVGFGPTFDSRVQLYAAVPLAMLQACDTRETRPAGTGNCEIERLGSQQF